MEKNWYKLGEKIGLNKKEIDEALKYKIKNEKNISISSPVDDYIKGTTYGSISTKDF